MVTPGLCLYTVADKKNKSSFPICAPARGICLFRKANSKRIQAWLLWWRQETFGLPFATHSPPLPIWESCSLVAAETKNRMCSTVAAAAQGGCKQHHQHSLLPSLFPTWLVEKNPCFSTISSGSSSLWQKENPSFPSSTQAHWSRLSICEK